MKKIAIGLLIIALLITMGVGMSYCKSFKRELIPKKIVVRFSIGKKGDGLGEFNFPSNLAIKEDNLFVTDCGNNRIQVLKINPDGSLSPKFIFGKAGKGLGEFGYFSPDNEGQPSSLGLAMKGDNLFVADSANNRIQVLRINPDGSLSPKFTFGSEGKGLGEFRMYLPYVPLPIGLAIKEDYLFIADWGNSRIQVLRINPDGNLSPVFTFGKKGKKLGEFGELSSNLFGNIPTPLGLAIKGDNLFIADAGNNRIQVFSINPDGSLSPKFTFGNKGEGLGEFEAPFSLATKNNYIYIPDSGNHRIQIVEINPDGNFSPKITFGKKGNGLGEFSNFLTALVIKNNYIYVADTGNNRIQVLEIKY